MSTVLEPIIVTLEEEKPIYTEKDIIKIGFGFFDSTTDEIVNYAIKNLNG